MKDLMPWLWWFLSLFSPSCLVWSQLTLGAIETDPLESLRRARDEIVLTLLAQEHAAQLAVAADRLGARGLRALFGFPPDPDTEARRLFEYTQARLNKTWEGLPQLARTLPPAAPHGPAPPGALQALAEGTIAALKEPLTPRTQASAPAPGARPGQAIVARLDGSQQLLAESHQAVSRLLIRSVVWTGALCAALALGLTAAGASTFASPPRSAPDRPLTKLSLRRRLLSPRAAAGPRQTGTLFKRLHEGLVPTPVASDIAEWLSQTPDVPGSLRGHDPEPGGLHTHTIAVIEAMKQLTVSRPPREQALAATVAATHDLGKLLAYREDPYGTWSGHPAVPHDSLGAQLLALAPGLWQSFSRAEIEDLLLVVSLEHAASRDPTLIPTNARPRVRELLEWLHAADAAAVGPIPTAPAPNGEPYARVAP